MIDPADRPNAMGAIAPSPQLHSTNRKRDTVGMKLAGLVMTKWAPHLPDRAFRVLMRMAMTALDEPTPDRPAEMFFGGRELLVSVLRAERYGNLKALEKALERAVKDLIEMGAIERTNTPRAGHRAEYRLTLFGAIRIDGRAVDNPVQQPIQPDTHVGAEGDTHVPEPDTHVGAEGDTRVPSSPTPTWGPRRKEETRKEELKEQPEEEEADLRGSVAVRARATEPPPEEIPPRCRNPECMNGSVIDKTKPKGQRITPCPECQPPDNVIQFGRRRA